MKTILIDHPTNRNLKLEIDVPDDEPQPEFIGGTSPKGTGDNPRMQLLSSKGTHGLRSSQNGGAVAAAPGGGGGGNGGGGSKATNTKGKSGGGGGAVVPVAAYPVDNSCLALVPELYDFVGMLANALSMHAYKPLLADPSKGWYEQPVPDSICVDWQFVKMLPSSTKHILSESDWNRVVRSVFSAETFGGMLRSYQSLTVCIAQGITMRQLVESPLTNAQFAELVAATTRQGAGGSAQPGRFYGYKGGVPQRWAYNVHAGLQFQERNAKSIAYLKIWFTGIKMDSDSKKLMYTQPDIPKSKFGFY